MPLRLIDNPRKVRTLTDDMESLYWSLLYGALRFVKHDNSVVLLGKNDFFSSVDEPLVDEEDDEVKVGALAKREWLRDGSRLASVKWSSDPFSEFMQDVTKIWARFYRHVDTDDSKDFGDSIVDPDEWDKFCIKLSKTNWFVKKIDKALAKYSSGWKDDMVQDQFPKKTAEEVRALLDDIQATKRNASRMSIDPRSRKAGMPGHSVRKTESRMQVDPRTSLLKRRFSIMHDGEPSDLAIPGSSDPAPSAKNPRLAQDGPASSSGSMPSRRWTGYVCIAPLVVQPAVSTSVDTDSSGRELSKRQT